MIQTITEFARPHEILRWTILAGKGIAIEQVTIDAMVLPPHYHDRHLLIVYQAPGVVVERQRGNQSQTALFQPGDVGIYPVGEYDKIAWKAPVDNLMLHLDAPTLARFAETRLDICQLALQDQFLAKDPLIGTIGQLLLTHQPTDATVIPLYTESLCDTLSYHLLQHYARLQPRRPPDPARLPTEVIRRIDDYIATHLADPITLDGLAELAHSSAFHFARRFKKTTGLSPYQYVLRCRTEHARRLLRQVQLPVAEVAHRLGFGSASHFDTFFKKQTGQTPRQYRQR